MGECDARRKKLVKGIEEVISKEEIFSAEIKVRSILACCRQGKKVGVLGCSMLGVVINMKVGMDKASQADGFGKTEKQSEMTLFFI